ncbi:hypothetical protein J6590_047657 [Homalodisca vitripennis]|nr:hypothetical protein J6590_047657 [Homalodisca vitripennis]
MTWSDLPAGSAPTLQATVYQVLDMSSKHNSHSHFTTARGPNDGTLPTCPGTPSTPQHSPSTTPRFAIVSIPQDDICLFCFSFAHYDVVDFVILNLA